MHSVALLSLNVFNRSVRSVITRKLRAACNRGLLVQVAHSLVRPAAEHVRGCGGGAFLFEI